MTALDQSFIQLLTALGALIVALGRVLVPFLPLVVWIAFWTLAVNWTKLRVVLPARGLDRPVVDRRRVRARLGNRGPATHRFASSARPDAGEFRRQNGLCDDVDLHHVLVRFGPAFGSLRQTLQLRGTGRGFRTITAATMRTMMDTGTPTHTPRRHTETHFAERVRRLCARRSRRHAVEGATGRFRFPIRAVRSAGAQPPRPNVKSSTVSRSATRKWSKLPSR